MHITRLYNDKKKTADEAVKMVKSGDWVDYGFAMNMPQCLDAALAKRCDTLYGVNIRGALAIFPLEIIECENAQNAFTYNSWHFSAYERRCHDQGKCYYIPMLYRNLPSYYRNGLTVDVAMISVSAMDSHGYFNFSLTNSATSAILETAKIIILEVNPALPIVNTGAEGFIHISEVDAIVENGDGKLAMLASGTPTETDLMIANQILPEITDGATIQLGIGTMPNTVGKLIAQSDLKHLGMHTEMLVDAYLDMFQSGKLTNKAKNIHRGIGLWTFCLGSEALYQWVEHNPSVASYPVNYTNDPDIMKQIERLTTINNCVEVDIYGQVCSESAGTRQISGTGGQLDFVTGGYLSRGGKSFVCFSATYRTKSGELKSRIVPTLSPGGIVTDPRTQIQNLVTEFGTASLAGKSTWERAEAIIAIAHPDLRESLIKDAENMKIWRRTQKIAF
ncbi:butyryl-CoA:acetate CoA-transferase [Fusibacter paucivorans]|uniref:Probable butyrate:acetyl-CoA coenzyme A-transferase n=1 Tax=Fusibacter paucivorans TaxID=76009 RepID=A0ABS5PTY6_9FIRM|nr:acetyl-CoA hydrolase/transferase C-terminal domain-containing protein [Fusibacter paucivorans]MBS7528337.1 butyryl-CoA:acetate CoA-transferase [Fusibacter paucivorans]